MDQKYNGDDGGENNGTVSNDIVVVLVACFHN